MSEIIASTYELIEEIGSGGGGVVYLANHLRLNKKVVLKADKRKISTKPELLRREVDVLKDLSHSYIPKVYDFFVENDTVYTVMDFIEGESLDKLLKRGEKIPQAQVIEWAKQLLEALDYLHSPTHGSPPRGFVHSDIKPANLMLTPYNKICLIDFNIALALGEKSVIGCSAGYASPEHYGLDYSSLGTHTGDTTIKLSEEEISGSVSASAVSEKKVLPDVRSDIYSTGATLYHLFSGRRPARNATEVVKLSDSEVSPQISAIIAKAMNPNPDLRYSSAAEMLHAFEHLHENDSRSRRYRRNVKICAFILTSLFFVGVFGAFVGLKRMQTTEYRLKLAEYAGNAIADGNTRGAIDYVLEACSDGVDLFSPNYPHEIQAVLSKALGVYDLSDGFVSDGTIELPSEPIYTAISPKGRTCALLCSENVIICDLDSAKIIATLPSCGSALSEVEYINEENVVYAGAEGLTVYNIGSNSIVWRGKDAVAISVSSDGKTIAAINKNESEAYVYNAADGAPISTVDLNGRVIKSVANDIFANPNENIFSLNGNGELLAVSFSDGSLSVFNTKQNESEITIFESNSDYLRFEGGFYSDYFAFSGIRNDGSDFAILDCKEKIQTGGFSSDDIYSVFADENGILVQTDNILVEIEPVTGEQRALVNTSENISRYKSDGEFTLIAAKNKFMFYDENANLISEYENRFSADFLEISDKIALVGSRDSNAVRILRYENNLSDEILRYDSDYVHDEARLSADEKTAMLFTYRGFRIYDADGTVIAEVNLPSPETVYDQQFKRDEQESYLEVTYIDGEILRYSAADGSLIKRLYGEKPDLSLNEKFYTSELKIEAPLHGVPKAYSRDNGKLIGELEKDAYLTYITETGEYIIAQYVTADGDFFGVLMNQKCEELARLPRLCDVVNDMLVFDYPTGNLRKSRIYTLNELLETARNYQ